MTEEPRKYLEMCYLEALKSPDPSTQNGAILLGQMGKIIGRGCNTFPDGIQQTIDRWHDRETKYQLVQHAERTAIYDAARNGNFTAGSTLYCVYPLCIECAKAVIGCGVSLVVGHKKLYDAAPDRWKGSIIKALHMLSEAGVKYWFYEGDLGNLKPIRFDGKLLFP